MPVQDVRLDRRHAVEVALEDLEGREVPAAVDEEPAPRKTRAVVDHHRGDPEALAARAHELKERLQPAQDPPRLGGSEGGFRGGDLEVVALVHAEGGEGGARRAVAADLEPGLAGAERGEQARLPGQPRFEPTGGALDSGGG